jgi:hypothetical protein
MQVGVFYFPVDNGKYPVELGMTAFVTKVRRWPRRDSE